MQSVTAYIGLGSNLDDPAAQVATAIDALAALPDCSLRAVSSFYRNPPMGPKDQPDYVNAVVALETRLAPRALLDAMQAIERAQGRDRSGQRWGPRTIDLDLLVYGDSVLHEDHLTVPHPGLAERAFVLVPLAEIAPHVSIPGHAALATLLAAVDRASVVPMPAPSRSMPRISSTR
ncbi:MAG: 2-amino-4-hydroxy-6-hydroxymethyldihydropteridine diphosphokinase [Proteobacteria bacterium]|jgi:2-amino-4-hydroxy-6-hydroxymethyldihydropteridine diphosphokinase|nr:2-amino-4-hydroxy-6-hydroxymethyldihydropteridine diphosphokinase [Pseudomonadota bacterium]